MASQNYFRGRLKKKKELKCSKGRDAAPPHLQYVSGFKMFQEKQTSGFSLQNLPDIFILLVQNFKQPGQHFFYTGSKQHSSPSVNFSIHFTELYSSRKLSPSTS